MHLMLLQTQKDKFMLKDRYIILNVFNADNELIDDQPERYIKDQMYKK